MSYDDDLADELRGYERVPPRLQPVLNVYGTTRRWDIAHRAGNEALRTCYALLAPLDEALAEGRQFIETRALGIAARAVKTLDLTDTVAALSQFGWGNSSIDRTTVRELAEAVQKVLASRLSDSIQRALIRWADRGVFELLPSDGP